MCSGKDYEFFYNSSDFYQLKTVGGPIWSLPKTNLFLIATIFCFFCSIVVNPFCYAAIYRLHYKINNSQTQNCRLIFIIRFRNKQDEKVIGLSSSARALRKRRNLVSVQFNFMNWLLETTSLSLLMIGDRWNVVLNLLYLLVNSCGTPLVILINCFFIFYQFFFS